VTLHHSTEFIAFPYSPQVLFVAWPHRIGWWNWLLGRGRIVTLWSSYVVYPYGKKRISK